MVRAGVRPPGCASAACGCRDALAADFTRAVNGSRGGMGVQNAARPVDRMLFRVPACRWGAGRAVIQATPRADSGFPADGLYAKWSTGEHREALRVPGGNYAPGQLGTPPSAMRTACGRRLPDASGACPGGSAERRTAPNRARWLPHCRRSHSRNDPPRPASSFRSGAGRHQCPCRAWNSSTRSSTRSSPSASA